MEILVVGRDTAILEVVRRLIDSHPGWTATTATGEKEAVDLFRQGNYPIVFIGAGFSQKEEEALRQRLLQLDPAVTVTRHYGGGSGLLENEILAILQTKKITDG
ncbi:MAG TPA: hypothetical protein VNU70_10380 [Puia sp.]|jgi:hypothetical protein|nr:hypothetical protein [Puia sp.]